jgi:hypothetical protein
MRQLFLILNRNSTVIFAHLAAIRLLKKKAKIFPLVKFLKIFLRVLTHFECYFHKQHQLCRCCFYIKLIGVANMLANSSQQRPPSKTELRQALYGINF